MKVIVVRRDEARPTVIEKSKPTPADDEVLIRTLQVGIDGTDHEVLSGTHGGFPKDSDHQVLGHEAIGVVEDPGNTNFEAGNVVVPTVRRPPADATNEYFSRGEPDMAPEGLYVERGIAGAHGFMAEYFTSPAEYLVPVDEELASYGFLIEPVSNSEKAIENANASRSAFTWEPDTAMVLGNGPLGLLTLAMCADRYDQTYCLGRRDRPDPTIDIIERLGATYVDSRETPLTAMANTYERVDFIYEATGHARHAFECVDALAPNGVAALLGIPENWEFDLDGGRLHRDLVLENKALVGSVNSNRRHFEAAKQSLTGFPDWFVDALVTDVYPPEEVARAFETDEETIKTAIEFDAL